MLMAAVSTLLNLLLPTRRPPTDPRRIVFILPCCIGDVIMATAALRALRRTYPSAHITWAIGSWSKAVIEHHDLLDAVLDTGAAALPVKSRRELLDFARLLRKGDFDLAVSLVRSPLMSLAVLLSGIPRRAGLDSGGRGFGYNIRASIDPHQPRHEAEIYLDVARKLGADTTDTWANVPVFWVERENMRRLLLEQGVREPFILINPAGGRNPGMVMDAKRWPPENFAKLAEHLAEKLFAHIVLLAGPDDEALVEAVREKMPKPPAAFIGGLSFEQIGALVSLSLLYIGNDTGLTHLAAAVGAKTVMILGPSDPTRYAPFSPKSLALWKPARLNSGGVSAGTPDGWNWAADGIGLDEVEAKIMAFVEAKTASE